MKQIKGIGIIKLKGVNLEFSFIVADPFVNKIFEVCVLPWLYDW
jgi:hypothetical protein